MELSQSVVIALVAVTTPVAVAKGGKSFSLIVAAAFSWVLLFFSIFFEPTTIIVPTRLPLTALFFEAIFTVVTIVAEIIGLYELRRH